VLVDQGISSLTNFLVTLYAMRTLSLPQFGVFSIVVGVYIVAYAVVRGLCVEVLLSSYASASEGVRRVNAARAVGATALLATVVVSVSLACLILPIGSQTKLTVIGASALLAPILIQDAWRYYWFCGPTAWGAALNDAVCLAATCCGAAWLSWRHLSGVLPVLGIWAAGAAVGAVVASIQLRSLPDLRHGLRWVRVHRGVGLVLFASGFVSTASCRLVPVLIGWTAGLAQVGRVAASLAILAPINVLTTASRVYLLPETARRVEHDVSRLPRLMASFSVLLAALPMLALAYAVVPDGVGQWYAGHNWTAAGECLLPIALWPATSAPIMIVSCGLRASGHLRTMLRLDLLVGAAQISGATIGAALAGGYGAAWGVVAANVLTLLAGARTFRRLHRRDVERIRAGRDLVSA